MIARVGVLAGAAALAATAAFPAPTSVKLNLAPARGHATATPLPKFAQPSHDLTADDAIPGKDGIKRMVILRGLDKITARAVNIYAPIGVPVQYATLTITARYCYSTPSTETPETTAFLQIVDKRPDQPERKVFSGWMLASSPSLNPVEHPLYDVWVISCKTNQPGQQAPAVASTAPVKPVSPDSGATEAMPELPEGSGQ
jgi:hypothetical protein